MLSFDNVPSSKMQKIYYDYLLHPQDIQRILDTTKDKVDKINGIIEQTILEVNASNKITTDSIREELDKLFERNYNIYTKPASYLYEVGNYIMRMFDGHMVNPEGYSTTTDYKVQRDYLYDLFNSNVSGRSFQFMKTDSGDYNHSHLTYNNYKLFKRDENDKLVPVDSVELHGAVRHVDLKFDVERYFDSFYERLEYRDNVDCKINLFKNFFGTYEQKNNILVYVPDNIEENQSVLSVPIRCEKTFDPATNYRYSSDTEEYISNYSIIPYDFVDGQYVLTPNKTLVYLRDQKDNYCSTESVPGDPSANGTTLVMQRIIQESDGNDTVFKLYRYTIPLNGPGSDYMRIGSMPIPKEDVRIVLDYVDGYIFVWYIFSGERSYYKKDFLLYVSKDSIEDNGSLISGSTYPELFRNLLGYCTYDSNQVNIPTVTKMTGLLPTLYSVDWTVFTKTLQNNTTDIERYVDFYKLIVSNNRMNPSKYTPFTGEDVQDFTNSTNIFVKNPRYKYSDFKLTFTPTSSDKLYMYTHPPTLSDSNYAALYALRRSTNGDYPSNLYDIFFGGLDSSGNFTSSPSILTIPSFYHYLTMKRLERLDQKVNNVTHMDSIEAIKVFQIDEYSETFFCAAIIGNRFELLVNYRQSVSGEESKIYNTLLPVRMLNLTSNTIENVLNSYNENVYRKIKFCKYVNPSDTSDRKIFITTDSPYLFTISNYDCQNSEIPEKLVCTITYVNDKNTSEGYRLFELENDIIFFPIRYSTYNKQTINVIRDKYENVNSIKKSPYTLEPGADSIEYISMNKGRLNFYIGYNDVSIVSNNTDTNTTFEVDYNYIPKDIFSLACKRVKEIPSSGKYDEVSEHDIVFRYGTYNGIDWFPMSTSNLSMPISNTVRFASIGTITSKDNDTRIIEKYSNSSIPGADGTTIMASSSLVDIGFGVSLETATGQKEIIKSFNKSLYGDKISITCAIDYTNILKPIIGIPFDSEFLSNVNTIELNLILLNKVKTTIYLFNCYHNNVIYPPKNVPNRGKLKAKIFVPSDLYGYYYNNRNDLFRLDASNPKTREEYYDHTIDIYDLGTLKKYLPSGDSSVSFDDIYDFNSLSGIEDDKEKFRNYVDDSRFVARIVFDEPTKLINIYPSVSPYKYGPDTVTGEKTGFEKFLNNGVRDFSKFKVFVSDLANGNAEFVVDVNKKTVELTGRGRTGTLDIYVNFLNVDQLNPDSEEVRKLLFPTIISKQFLPFYITIIRDDPYSKTDGENAYYDMYVEIENNNDMQFRIHTSKYVSSDITNPDISFDGGTLITRAIETSEYMSAELHNNTGNTAKKLLDSGQYKRGDIYYFVPIRSSKDFETNNVYIQKKV